VGPSRGLHASSGLDRCRHALHNHGGKLFSIAVQNEKFLEDLFVTLDETGLDPRCLELELTESALMKRAEVTASILSTLRGMGLQVAVDDLGTGYSSLSYLRKFPLDALKIDRSFVRQITTSDETASSRSHQVY
jgi:EAL domain-containing protein (putative c-di-GMP-specific phosphodiesterase class I)